MSKEETRNNEMNLAWQFVSTTGVSVFLTGKAGTGKTTFLRRMRDLMPKRMVVLAPTGVAAINAGGQTIHSFFQFPFGPFVPGLSRGDDRQRSFRMSQSKKNLIRTLDLLVIDEVSMVRADLLDQIDDILRRYRDWTKPFGGVQLLLIGDLMQLSPVASDEEWKLLAPYYDTPYFFSSRALRQLNYVTIELKHIYRQQDQDFVNLLAHVREGDMTADVIGQLNSRYIPSFVPKEKGWIRLTTHNHSARNYNEHFLSQLSTPARTFSAKIEGDFPEGSYPIEATLTLKVGAQVMFVKNDPTGRQEYYNGKIAQVTSIGDDFVEVESDGDTIKVTPVEWQNTKYTLDPATKAIKESIEGTFTHIPLRLAWAITVHKSQGLTFDRAVLDINMSFAHGQVYVALSRCRTLEGLVLSSPIQPQSVITDTQVNSYIDDAAAQGQQAATKLPQYRYEYLLSLLDELFSFTSLRNSFLAYSQVVDQRLFRQYPKLNELLKNVMSALDADIVAIAQKFHPHYYAALQASGGVLTESLLQRISSASAYFYKRLKEIFVPVVREAVININNQQLAQVYNNAFQDFKLDYDGKLIVFGMLIDEPFSVAKYLDCKAKAMLAPSDRKSPSRSKPVDEKKMKKSKEPSKPKPKKGDSALASLALYNEGLSVAEIASRRGFAESTIYGHLASFVADGRVDVNCIVPIEHQRLIREAIASFTSAYTASQIREKLPEDIHYGEVKIVYIHDNPEASDLQL